MDWKTKIKLATKEVELDEELEYDIRLNPNRCPEVFIESIKKRYDFIPSSFIELLEIMDGCEIGGVRFFGSGTKHHEKMEQYIEAHADVYSPNEWLPFACDAGGYPFLFDTNGEVFAGDAKSSSPKVEKLCATFDEFLADIVMGKDYEKIYPDSDDGDCYWWDFLRKMKWA